MNRWRLLVLALAAILLALPASALDWGRISLNGYTSFEFEYMFDDEGNGDPNGSFDADLFDLVLNIQVTDRIRAAADITWEHGAASEDDRGNVAIEYGFVEYSFSDMFRIRFGKMFTTFGIHNEIHTAKPAFLSVKEASSTNKPENIVDDAERFFPRWGTGIAFQGNGMMGDRSWDYNVLIANGEQEETNPFEEDNNEYKSVTGRFRLDLSDAVKVGASVYYDRMNGEFVDWIHSEGLQFELNRDAFRFLAEGVYGTQESQDGSSTNQLGAFIQPSYHFANGVTPYLRYEWIDPDRDASSDEGTDLIVGLNWEPAPWFMIKIENNWFHGGRNSTLAEFPGRGYNELKAAVVLGF